jgi:hypothetical protein
MAATLMDRYYEAKQALGFAIERTDLHLIGLGCFFIGSKYEDVRAVSMAQILQEAGHNKYNKRDILDYEQDLLRTLGFKMQTTTIYDRAMTLLKTFLFECKESAAAENIEISEEIRN